MAANSHCLYTESLTRMSILCCSRRALGQDRAACCLRAHAPFARTVAKRQPRPRRTTRGLTNANDVVDRSISDDDTWYAASVNGPARSVPGKKNANSQFTTHHHCRRSTVVGASHRRASMRPRTAARCTPRASQRSACTVHDSSCVFVCSFVGLFVENHLIRQAGDDDVRVRIGKLHDQRDNTHNNRIDTKSRQRRITPAASSSS
jgi:hypothetical protein